MIAVALAGSIFFSISPDAARTQVVLYLLLTMAPFSVVTPLIGPIIDRMPGGRRAMLFGTACGRGFLALLMVFHLDTLWLFPEAFALLVLQKGYAVAKSAAVPYCVPTESDLVQANSRLAMLSAVMGLGGAGIGALLVWAGGPPWAAAAAVAGYGFSTVLTVRMPDIPSAPASSVPVKWAVLHPTPVSLAASAMAIMRGAVGIVTFMLAFELRGSADGIDISGTGAALGAAVGAESGIGSHLPHLVGNPGPPPWHFGVVAATVGLSAFAGVRLAPILRQRFGEEMILLGSLIAGFTAALTAAISAGLTGLALLAAGVSFSSTIGKLAFDSLVQRDVPEASHGRFFARFEARFQVAWVIGAFVPVGVPVLLPLPAQIGSLVVATGLGFAIVSFVLGRRSAFGHS